MELERAIEIGTHISQIKALNNRPDEEAAIKLLIEAGKRFNSLSGYPHNSLGGPLPGETPEVNHGKPK